MKNDNLSMQRYVLAHHGAWPGDVLPPGAPRAPQRLGTTSGEESQADSPKVELPLPHPLDYDWRFSRATQKRLLREIELRSPVMGEVVLLGVPTLYLRTARTEGRRRVTLLDSNRRLERIASISPGTHHLKTLDLLHDPLPPLSADVVVADPPWYMDQFRAFVWAAGQVTDVGGSLLLATPAPGTRPSARTDVQEVERYARTLGFEVERRDIPLRYDTPFFEANALRAAGYPASKLPRWRAGCLMVLRRVSRQLVPRPRPLFQDEWASVTFGDVEVRVRTTQRSYDRGKHLSALVTGDVVPTVSARFSRRSRAAVWTSGNRAFRSGQPLTVLATLRQLIANNDVRTPGADPSLTRMLAALVATEQREASEYRER